MGKRQIRIRLDMTIELDGNDRLHAVSLPMVLAQALIDRELVPNEINVEGGARTQLQYMDQQEIQTRAKRAATLADKRKRQEAARG